MAAARHACCGFCGARFAPDAPFPRTCAACANVTYVNPLPVAVLLLPVDDGLLVVRRGIEPRKGQLALPGGFINLGESWQAAAARELEEEAQIRVSPDDVADFTVLSAPDGTVLVFGLHTRPLRSAELPPFVPNDEVSERTVHRAPGPLAFALHTRAADAWFARRR